MKTTVLVKMPIEKELPPLGNRYTYVYTDGETLCMAAEARHTVESLTRSRLSHWLKEIELPDEAEIGEASDNEGWETTKEDYAFITGVGWLLNKITGK